MISLQDSGMGSMIAGKRKLIGKENEQPLSTGKRVRKSLGSAWANEVSFVETPVSIVNIIIN